VDHTLLAVVAASAAFVVGLAVGYVVYGLIKRFKRIRSEQEAQQLVEDARRQAADMVREADLKAKDEVLRRREGLEQEASRVRGELRTSERRLAKREDTLDRKVDVLGKKEQFLDEKEEKLRSQEKSVLDRQKELDAVIEKENEALLKMTGLDREEARKMLFNRLEKQLEYEVGAYIRKYSERSREEAEQKARVILSDAINRCAVDYTAEVVVSTIDIANDDMKGRIIGREGRNIRAFEKATGVDVIVDDAPGVVVISGSDSVRRETGRRAMQKLIADGRIHPARIEEVVEATRKEMDEVIQEAGKQASFEAGIHGLHPKEITLLGRLKFRTSYGQNVLKHSLEVASLAGLLAGELKLDVQLAKRCGFLHDIGKAVDHEIEGGHPQIGADLAKRYDERPLVVNAIAAHHEDVKPESIYAVLVATADSISAARPGARRETLEKYVQRLEKLEQVAHSFPGVERAYAIQAGREIRVIVDSSKIDDRLSEKTCRDIAQQIEQTLNYPGEIKVTLLREKRVVEYAR